MHRKTWARTRSVAVVEDRSDIKVDGLDRAEGPLHTGQALVGGDRCIGVELLRGETGADDVQAVQGGFGVDGLASCASR